MPAARRLEALGEDVGKLVIGGNALESEMSDLCRFVRKMLTNVYMLRTLSATDHIVSPLNACSVVIKLASEMWVRSPYRVAVDAGR